MGGPPCAPVATVGCLRGDESQRGSGSNELCVVAEPITLDADAIHVGFEDDLIHTFSQLDADLKGVGWVSGYRPKYSLPSTLLQEGTGIERTLH